MFHLHKSTSFKICGGMSETLILIYISVLCNVVIDDAISNMCFSKQYSYIDCSNDTSWHARVKNMFSFFGFVWISLYKQLYSRSRFHNICFLSSNSFSYHLSSLNSAIRMANRTPRMPWVSEKDGQPLAASEHRKHKVAFELSSAFLLQMKTWGKWELCKCFVLNNTHLQEV